MGKIRQLPPHEAHKIAAGEVVERPASVIKELVENSIDAGATTLSIFVKDSGKTLIRIVDNGCGMNQEDAELCFSHHATSKIKSVDELSSIASFGFRGEALSSISAVSKVSLITKEATQSSGILIERESDLNTISSVAAQNGTDIAIHDLFYNVPARKKFLKSDQTEWRQIVQLFQAFCFDYPHIHFKLYSQDTLSYNCPPTETLMQRAQQILDPHISNSLLELEQYQNGSLTIQGVISDHQLYRYDRGLLFFFVNQRWVKNSGLSKACVRGYLNILPPDKFPVALLKITIDKQEVDINVHPRKEEVAFLHPRILENAIQETIKKSLSLKFPPEKKEPIFQSTQFRSQRSSSDTLAQPVFSLPPTLVRPAVNSDYFSPPPFITPAFVQPKEIAQPILQTPDVTETIDASPDIQIPINEETPLRLIGIFAQTYLLLEQENGLLLIDQHAAHERILYEQFRSRFGELPTIQLLFPDVLELSSDEIETTLEYKDFFAKHGIILDQLSKTHIAVQAIPAHLKNASRKDLIKESLALIAEHQELPKEEFFKKVHEKMHAQMACKAAVKAGDQLSLEQQHELIAQLEKCENQIACPHGRPTRWLLSTYEIEKKFKRKV
ncbi:MAG TPA: DNA mismatch repair endonuclease MutL [Candidatus Babeliales bacterium]|nr:DNA mismatch repair endonuclease MutL [Candidatus Babeliales bacterium]